MHRRDLLKSVVTGAAVYVLHLTCAFAEGTSALPESFAALEHRHGGRLGVAVLDTETGNRFAHRGDQRFLMFSTFKVLLVAAVLARVDHGKERLEQRIVFDKSALLDWAPVAKLHVGPPGMSIAALCEAAITVSDNTTANLLLHLMGGPGAVTHYARSLGDRETRLDRTEPTLNRPDGELDTTTPWAMLGDMRRLLLGDALIVASRERLTEWLRHCQSGTNSLPAGLPSDWREGDKTGSGDTATNDVAIFSPPQRKPLLVIAYYENASVSARQRYAVLADTGRIVAAL